jgi:hypothetical protein
LWLIYLIYILISSCYVHLFFPSSFFLRDLLVKSNMLLFSTPSVPYGFPSFPLWFSAPQSYLTRYTNHKSSRFVRICRILLISFGPKIVNQLVVICWQIWWTSRQKGRQIIKFPLMFRKATVGLLAVWTVAGKTCSTFFITSTKKKKKTFVEFVQLTFLNLLL